MEIKVLGPGCTNCKRLYNEAQAAVDRLGIPATLIKVEDIKEIMAYGVMATPALVVNGEVKSYGRVPRAEEIAGWLATVVEQPQLR